MLVFVHIHIPTEWYSNTGCHEKEFGINARERTKLSREA